MLIMHCAHSSALCPVPYSGICTRVAIYADAATYADEAHIPDGI